LSQDEALGKRGVDALLTDIPVQQLTDIPVQQPTDIPVEQYASVPAKRFEKATFYFEPEDLSQLDRMWLELMGQGIRCNKSEIVSAFLKAGLSEYVQNPSHSALLHKLTGRRRRA
jgi:hypothetical protein